MLPLICELVANHELREESFRPDVENRSAPMFVKGDVLLESRGRPAGYRRRDAAHNLGADASETIAKQRIEVGTMRRQRISDPQPKGIRGIRLLSRVAP